MECVGKVRQHDGNRRFSRSQISDSCLQFVWRGPPTHRQDDEFFDVLLVDMRDVGTRIYTFNHVVICDGGLY